MYTNPKPHVLPEYAQAPFLSRPALLFSAVMLVGAVSGGLLGLFNERSYPAASAQAVAAEPAAQSASAAVGAAADTRVAMQPRGHR